MQEKAFSMLRMALLNASLLIFVVLLKNDFIIYRPSNVNTSYVCLNELNDTFPFNWIKLNPIIQDGIPVFHGYNISGVSDVRILKYKVKFIFSNGRVGDSRWKRILNEAISGGDATLSTVMPTSDVRPLRNDSSLTYSDGCDIFVNIAMLPMLSILLFTYFYLIVKYFYKKTISQSINWAAAAA